VVCETYREQKVYMRWPWLLPWALWLFSPFIYMIDIRACSKTRLVLEQALGKPGLIGLKSGPVFPIKRKLFQKLKFWNSLITEKQ
jgi:hypothetical protein